MADEFSEKQLAQLQELFVAERKHTQAMIMTGVGEALEQIVLPRLMNLETDVGSLKTDVGSLKTDVGSLKTDVGSLKTDVGSLKEVQREQGEQLDRIERKQNATIVTTDHLETRLKVLETKLSI